MTLEDMQAEQARLETALRDAGYAEVASLPFEPGDDPAVAFLSTAGEELVATLAVL